MKTRVIVDVWNDPRNKRGAYFHTTLHIHPRMIPALRKSYERGIVLTPTQGLRPTDSWGFKQPATA